MIVLMVVKKVLKPEVHVKVEEVVVFSDAEDDGGHALLHRFVTKCMGDKIPEEVILGDADLGYGDTLVFWLVGYWWLQKVLKPKVHVKIEEVVVLSDAEDDGGHVDGSDQGRTRTLSHQVHMNFFYEYKGF
ncbi:hypothetical protein Tco_0774934 [Tanacetum coccineum]|uniref:Uncharacterized protein n=1 Tax=Tanacetum coccineum TaxID=301880 RepID=A0ABQ4ZTZ2_9ASTR